MGGKKTKRLRNNYELVIYRPLKFEIVLTRIGHVSIMAKRLSKFVKHSV